MFNYWSLCFDTAPFHFFFVFENNLKFYDFILFPCRIITLLTSPIEQKLVGKKHSVEKGAYLNMSIVFALLFSIFGLRHSYLANFLVFLSFCLFMSFVLLLYALYLLTIGLNCFPRKYNST